MEDEKSTTPEIPDLPGAPWQGNAGDDQGNDEPSIGDLVNQGALISNGIATYKEKIKKLETELAGVNEAIIPLAKFRKGSKTGHLEEDGIHAKVVHKETVTYNPDKLAVIKPVHPSWFSMAFKETEVPASTKYAVSSKKQLKAACDNEPTGDFRSALEWAKEVKPGKTTVAYTLVEKPDPSEEGGEPDA